MMHPLITPDDQRLSNRIAADYLQVFLSRSFAERAEPDYSRAFSIAHMSTFNTIQLLGIKRGLSDRELELARITALLHDAHTNVTGSAEDHAKRSGAIAASFLAEDHELTLEEKEMIVEAISHHSEKDIDSGDWLVELMKDADVLDTFLHSTHGYADRVAPRKRAERILKELGIEFKL